MCVKTYWFQKQHLYNNVFCIQTTKDLNVYHNLQKKKIFSSAKKYIKFNLLSI